MKRTKRTIITILAALLGLLIVVSVGLAQDDIAQESRWSIESADGETISQHDQQHVAIRRALELSRETGQTYYVAGNRIRVKAEQVQALPPVEPIDPPVVDPDPVEPPGEPSDRLLVPGDGNATPLPPLGQIGQADEIAIAQWNAVPQQQISGAFNVGVVAHHVDGIDHVAFSLDGGPWRKIAKPSINPRTGSDEYWATIPAGSGWRNVRAVAVPVTGKPRDMGVMRVHSGDSADLFREIVLQAGTYDAQALLAQGPAEGWLTIRPADGVDRSKVIIKGNASSAGRHIRFENITRKLGRWDEHNSRTDGNSWWWFDNCRIEGTIAADGPTRWILNEGGRQYYTDTTITDINATFQSATLLARNVVIEDAVEDVCRVFGMMVNVTINKVDRGQFTDKHPDLFQWAGFEVANFIAQDVTSLNNVGQGLFTGPIKDSAFVRVNINVDGNYYGLQMLNTTRNVLLKDFKVSGGLGCILRSDDRFNFLADRLVLKNSSPVRGDDLPGVEVLP